MSTLHRSPSLDSGSTWGEDEDEGVVNPSGPSGPNIEPSDEITVEGEDGSSQASVQNVRPSVDGISNQRCTNCWIKFKHLVRSLWATCHTEDTKSNRELLVKLTLRELVIFIIFLILLCIAVFSMTSSTTFYFTSVIASLFVDVKVDPYDADTSFKDISNANEWYQYALGPLMDGLYPNKDGLNVSIGDQGIVLQENSLIGVPRIRLLRVRNNSCVVHQDFQDLISQCYGPFSSENEDQNPFGPMNSSSWRYSSAQDLGGNSYWGKVSTYTAGGYIRDLTLDKDTSKSLINQLQLFNWLDRGTRAVFIDFSLYNPNINLFCVVRLLTEFPATGGAITSWSFRTVKLFRYVYPLDYFVLACECLLIVFILYYIVEEILEIKRNRLSYFKSFWNILDLAIIVVSICCISFNIYRTIDVNQTLMDQMHRADYYIDLDGTSYWQIIFDYSQAIAVFLAWIKLFKFISFNKTMTQLTRTMGACSKDIFGFSLMFFIVFLAFAQLGYLIFGMILEDYCNFQTAIFTQFRILLGDFKFDDFVLANRLLGPAYFVLFVFFLFFILLNMFLAIMNDAYSEVKAELSRQKNEFEMTDYFKMGYKKMMDKLNFRRNKGIQIQKTNPEGKRVNIKEWRRNLKRRGYAEAEIEAVCSKYDLTKGGAMPEGELHKVEADLNKKKYNYDNMDDSLDDSDDENSTYKSSDRRTSGSGVSHEEFSLLQRRVDRMEHSIGSVVSKIDAILVKLESMEQSRAKRRETMGRLLDSIAESEGVTDESKQQYMERLVRDELERWDSLSCISGFGPSLSSNNSGRGSSRDQQAAQPPQEYSSVSNT